MKKKALLLGLAVCILGGSSLSVYAQTKVQAPVQVLSDLTGKTVESLIQEKVETGKTYGTIASEAGQLEAFKEARLEAMKEHLEQQVQNGILTEEQAQQRINRMKENQASCDGTGSGNNQGCQLRTQDGSSCRQNRGRGQGRSNKNCIA